MDADALCPHPLTRADAAVLIGVTAVLAGESMIGELEPDLAEHLARRFRREGLLDAADGPEALAGALDDLSQRVRTALGKHDEP